MTKIYYTKKQDHFWESSKIVTTKKYYFQRCDTFRFIKYRVIENLKKHNNTTTVSFSLGAPKNANVVML
jgi:hypothetical protein